MDRTTADNVKAILKESLPEDVGIFRIAAVASFQDCSAAHLLWLWRAYPMLGHREYASASTFSS